MRGLRLLLLTGCLGAIAVAAASASWEGHLILGGHTWIMDLGRHPVWNPPAAPDYDAFRNHFERSKEFPPPDGGWGIDRHCDLFGIGLMAVAYSWPITLVCGLAYIAIRGLRRDVVLHCALWAAGGMSLGFVACIALWFVAGGWGPPMPGCFAFIGVIGGIYYGLASFARASRKCRGECSE
jgi:hypothetical protein